MAKIINNTAFCIPLAHTPMHSSSHTRRQDSHSKDISHVATQFSFMSAGKRSVIQDCLDIPKSSYDEENGSLSSFLVDLLGDLNICAKDLLL